MEMVTSLATMEKTKMINNNNNNEDFTLIQNKAEFDRHFPAFIFGESRFGIDIETMTLRPDFPRDALDPLKGRIRLIQVSNERDETIVIDMLDFYRRGKIADELKQLVELIDNPKILKIAHNAKFEIGWFIIHLGAEPQSFFDTMLASQIIYAGDGAASNKLDAVAEVFLGIEVDKSEQTSDWSKPNLTWSQIAYAVKDAQIMIPLWREMVPRLEADDLLLTAVIDFDAVKPITRTELNGMHLNRDKWTSLLREKEAELADLNEKMLSMLSEGVDWTEKNPNKGRRPPKPKKPVSPARSKRLQKELGLEPNTPEMDEAVKEYERKLEHYRTVLVKRHQHDVMEWEKIPSEIPATLNPNSIPQMQKALKNVTGIHFNSTRSKFLSVYRKDYPVIDTLIKFREASKAVSSYGENFLELLDNSVGGDNRIHPDFIQIKDTGRMGCRKPNLQQIPHDKEYRYCFDVPNDSRKMVVSDYSQIELRLLADFSQDEKFIADFGSGDMHSQGAARFNEIKFEEVTGELRQEAKRTNFGVVYGIGDYGLSMQLDVPEERAKWLKEMYFKTYKGNDLWLQMANRQARVGKFARTASGRLQRFYPGKDGWNNRQLGAIGRNGQNMPIQGSGADMLKRAIYLIDYDFVDLGYSSDGDAMLVNLVHDEVVGESSIKVIEKVSRIINRRMVEAGKQYVSAVDIESDVVVGDVWEK